MEADEETSDDGDDDDDDDDDDDGGAGGVSGEQLRSYWRVLLGSRAGSDWTGSAATTGAELVTSRELMGSIGRLGLEITAEQADLMIDVFDGASKGGIDFGEFRRIVRAVAVAPAACKRGDA